MNNILKRTWGLSWHIVKWFQVLQSKSNISHLFIYLYTVSSIWPVDRTLSDAITPGERGSRSNGNEEVLRILQISKARASPSDCLGLYPGHLLGVVLPLAEMKSVRSNAPANWAGYLLDEVTYRRFHHLADLDKTHWSILTTYQPVRVILCLFLYYFL